MAGKSKKKKKDKAVDAANALLAELEGKTAVAGVEGEGAISQNEGGTSDGTSGKGKSSKSKGSKRKGKKGTGKSKGKKGKKGKKGNKGTSEETTISDSKPKYTQKDIDDYLKKKEKEKKKLKEHRLVQKMQAIISIVRPEDSRWTTWTLAPLYKFLRSPTVEVLTVFLKKTEVKKEEKKLIWADDDEDDEPTVKKDSAKGSGTEIGLRKSKSVIDRVASGRIEKQSSTSTLMAKTTLRPSTTVIAQRQMAGVNGYHLIVLNDVVPNDSPDMFYFVKLKQTVVDKDNFFQDVLFGNIPGGHLASLHALLSYVYTPMFYQPNVLPESIRNEFFASMNSVMGPITEIHNRLQGQTVLYVPKEATSSPIDIVSKDKELCARLESSMVHWIREIKEVVMNQTMQDQDDWAGPLDEIAFWQTRSQDLAGLTAQIRSRPVRTVKQIMTIIKSPFVTNFNMVSSEILGASSEAISNLHYLNVLIQPCQKLHDSKVKEVPEQLQNLLWLIRVIWLNSPFYNTRERLNGLLRKVSNEMISHCVKEIDVDKVFNGHIESSEALINECIRCCKFWKNKYFEAQKMHSMNSYLSWLLEYDHIFSHLDAFIKRLQDLLEICVCQRLYARRVEGNQEPLPLYPGTKGPEITRTMKEVQKMLDRNLKDMYQSRHLILDVKNVKWYDNMGIFKAAVRDMEMMVQNVLFSSFETVTNLEHGIQILETFYVFYQRDIITRAYDKLIVKLFKLFEEETSQVRNLYAKNILPLPLVYPQLAGRGAWAMYLQRRLDMQLSLLAKAWWLPECGYGDDVKEQAIVLSRVLSEFFHSMYQEWVKTLGTKDHIPRLDIPLMARSTYKFGMIEVNFDKVLARHIVEAEMWSRLSFEIPSVLLPVYNQRERLHNLRETVLLVVKDYNRIVSALSPEERNLFKERIKLLDRKVYPGLTRLTWASDVSDAYINECRQAASKVQGFTNDYKNANVKIGKLSTRISNHLMIKIDQKRIFEKNEFNDFQDKHRNKSVLKIANEYKNITLILRSVFEMFKTDGPEVKNHWIKYLKKIDEVVEEAFCLNIRRSLEILNRTVHGDVRGPPPPIFKLDVILDGNKLGFSPSLSAMEDMILGIYRRICITIQPFPRVIQFLNDPKTVVDLFSQVIAKDEIARGTQEQVAEGMLSCISEVEKYLQTWEPYRDVWELDKDEFMTQYEKQNPSVNSYDTDIERYFEVVDAVQGCESVVTVVFCILDCLTLKETIADHCRLWQERLMTNLYEKASAKLQSIYKYIEDNISKFKNEPVTIPDLVNAFKLFRSVQADAQLVEKEFPTMAEQFALLNKNEYDLGNYTKTRVLAFPEEWHNYLLALKEIEFMLKGAKEKLRQLLFGMAERFRQRVYDLIFSFETKGPFYGKVDSDLAVDLLLGFRQTMYQLKKDESDLLNSLTIFEIDMAPNMELRKFEKDLTHLESVWAIVYEWEGYWEEYKTEPFITMKTGAMEEVGLTMLKKIHKVAIELEKENWPVIKDTITRLEVFKRSIPLIHVIKNPSLRERHWKEIFELIGSTFDPNDLGFTFEVIISYGMEKFANEINEIVSNSLEELVLENGLNVIRKFWKEKKLDMTPYKETGHYILNTIEDVMEVLRDHIGAITEMKLSRYSFPFEIELANWLKTFSVIKNALETFLNVQAQWVYLENINLEEIRKQLPKETKEFDMINLIWKNITQKMAEDSFVVQATQKEGLVPVLRELFQRLENVIKALETFEEAKNEAFA